MRVVIVTLVAFGGGAGSRSACHPGASGWAAGQGISQFIDLGVGLPVSPSVHWAVRAVMPTAKVAYVDLDPVVLSYARALSAIGDGVTAVAANLGSPGTVLTDPELRAVIDPAWARVRHPWRGLALHARRYHPRGDREYAWLLAPGSCLVISVAHFDDDRISKELAKEYSAAEWYNHSRADVGSFSVPWTWGARRRSADVQGVAREPVWRRRDSRVLAGVGRVPESGTGGGGR